MGKGGTQKTDKCCLSRQHSRGLVVLEIVVSSRNPQIMGRHADFSGDL